MFQDLFAVVIGGEDVSNHKPDPEGLIKAMAILDTTPEQCFYIGDSRIDADTAERAQVDFIAVTKKEEFRYAKTHSVLNNLYELI